MASRGSVFWVLSALALCSKFVGGTALEARFGWDGLDIRSTTAESTHTNNVADQLPAFDESRFEWETLTSKNGAPFRVGREKAVAAEPFNIRVDWPADGKWKSTPTEVVDISGITYVNLADSGKSGPDRYRFQLRTTKSFEYTFETATGETIDVETTQPGRYTVKFTAKDPTIVQVTGS